MEFSRRTLMQIADMICGNSPRDGKPNHFRYRSSSMLTEFFWPVVRLMSSHTGA